MKTRNERIAELNDLCRTAMGVAGRLVQTQGKFGCKRVNASVSRWHSEMFYLLLNRNLRMITIIPTSLRRASWAGSRRRCR